MARKKQEIIEENIVENISIEPLENVMGDRYATYAKYVIQDRAIPDVRDGLKPVQRRIVYTMYINGNTINKPTKKCAHTVGAVMGTFHPHGDTSIYEALARMSQDWKVRYPLIDFQGNNGSIDGDMPAAYRYTESRLSEISNELIRDLDKKTVDMQLNFDDTEFEPTVLPSRFPNLLANGTEGIAVALATEIPPHNLKEIIDATIYRINHKTATIEDLLTFVKGPDFPGGGIIYLSDGLKNIYTTGRGRIEVASKCEISYQKDSIQIIITEIPYKVVKSQLVYEIDKIIHSKAISGLTEIRDESDWKGIRIVIECKKDAKVDIILNYLKAKTALVTGYSANMVAIVNGKPKTLNLLEFVDAYIAHQIDVITRKSKFDLEKYSNRLHIVEGLIIASINITEIVEIIRKSKDKADSKANIILRFKFSNEQAEAIVTMPLFKLSHTDEEILLNEKNELLKNIEFINGILSDSNKLNRLLIKDLKAIYDKYGDDRRTNFEEKGDIKPIDKRDLIAKEEVYVSVSKDGYAKRSTIKSYKSSGENTIPGIKTGDAIVAIGTVLTTDYLICFTNLGNFASIPVHKLQENKWKDEGLHINSIVNLNSGEKIIKCIAVRNFRNDIFVCFLSKNGQIKKTPISSFECTKFNKPIKCMNLCGSDDQVVSVQILDGNSDLLVLSNSGTGSLYNEKELNILGIKAGGVKSINGLGAENHAVSLIAFNKEEKSKVVLLTNKGHYRIIDKTRIALSQRLAKTSKILPCFKQEPHKIIAAIKLNKGDDKPKLNLYLNDDTMFDLILEDTYLTDPEKYAKKNINIPPKTNISCCFNTNIEIISDKTESKYVVADQKKDKNITQNIQDSSISKTKTQESNKSEEKNKEKNKIENDASFEQLSIFDDLDK